MFTLSNLQDINYNDTSTWLQSYNDQPNPLHKTISPKDVNHPNVRKLGHPPACGP